MTPVVPIRKASLFATGHCWATPADPRPGGSSSFIEECLFLIISTAPSQDILCIKQRYFISYIRTHSCSASPLRCLHTGSPPPPDHPSASPSQDILCIIQIYIVSYIRNPDILIQDAQLLVSLSSHRLSSSSRSSVRLSFAASRFPPQWPPGPQACQAAAACAPCEIFGIWDLGLLGEIWDLGVEVGWEVQVVKGGCCEAQDDLRGRAGACWR